MNNNSGFKSFLTVRSIMKIAAVLILVFAFCPMFLVSCSGQEVSIGVLDAVSGIESGYGDRIVDPNPLLIVCFILPIAIIVLLFLKKMNQKTNMIAVCGAAAADFIALLMFRGGVANFCRENHAAFSSTGIFKFDIFLHILVIAGAGVCIAKILDPDSSVFELADSEAARSALSNASATLGNLGSKAKERTEGIGTSRGPRKPSDIICRCTKCGKAIRHGETACASCGTAVHPEVLAQAEADYEAALREYEDAAAQAEAKRQADAAAAAERRAEAARRQEAAKISAAAAANPTAPLFCQYCGSKLHPGDKFCESCGKPVDPLP